PSYRSLLPDIHPLLLPIHPHCPLPDLHSFPTRRSSDLAIRYVPYGHAADRITAWPSIPRRTRVRSGEDVTPLGNRPRRHIAVIRSEEHTSELQSQSNLVCRLLLEKKKNIKSTTTSAPTT